MKNTIFIAAIILVSAIGALAQNSTLSEVDRDAIKATALDYIEGWYEGNAERMERSLHPDLAKRIVRTNAEGQSTLGVLTAAGLVEAVKKGGGKNTPKENQIKEVTILDLYRNAASVKVVAGDWIDFMHLAKWNGRWVIVNVLWELKPKK